MSDAEYCKSFILLWGHNHASDWFAVIDGKFKPSTTTSSTTSYNVLQCYPDPPSSTVAGVMDDSKGERVVRLSIVKQEMGGCVLICAPVSGEVVEGSALVFAFDSKGIVAASILEELQLSHSFMSKPFWKNQLLWFSPDVSSLTMPTLDMEQRRIYISQLVDSMFAMENVNDGVIDLLVHVALDEDTRRSAVGLVSKLHNKYLRTEVSITEVSSEIVVNLASNLPQHGEFSSEQGKQGLALGRPDYPVTENAKETGELVVGSSSSLSSGDDKSPLSHEDIPDEDKESDVNLTSWPVTANLKESGRLAISLPPIVSRAGSSHGHKSSSSREGPSFARSIGHQTAVVSKLTGSLRSVLPVNPIANNSTVLCASPVERVTEEQEDVSIEPANRPPTSVGDVDQEQQCGQLPVRCSEVNPQNDKLLVTSVNNSFVPVDHRGLALEDRMLKILVDKLGVDEVLSRFSAYDRMLKLLVDKLGVDEVRSMLNAYDLPSPKTCTEQNKKSS